MSRIPLNLTRKLSPYWKLWQIFASKPLPLPKPLQIKGWVHSIRKQKECLFVDVVDGTCSQHLQVVLSPERKPLSLSRGCSIEVNGSLVASSHPGQQFEMMCDDMNVIGPCDTESYPLLQKRQPVKQLRPHPHLRSRTKAVSNILRVRSTLASTCRKFLEDHNFTEIHTPIITSNDCEGAGEVFTISTATATDASTKPEHFFDKEVYLSVSGQLHLEAMACALGQVYTLSPVFRAENSRTRHHLSEFYMLEAEIAFCDTLDELMQFIEELICSVVNQVTDKCPMELEWLHSLKESNSRADFSVLEKRFERLLYSEAVKLIQQQEDLPSLKFGDDLLKIHEQFLVQHCENRPVFISEWPASLKPFYMKSASGNPETVAAVDLLLPGVGEVAGGSIREDDLVTLCDRVKALQLEQQLSW